MKFENYSIKLNEVLELNKDKRRIVLDMFRDMLFAHKDGNLEMSKAMFNSLYYSGFIYDIREKKISDIIDDGVQDINN
jgi:hypothetical protein